jgi:intracellular septation protein
LPAFGSDARITPPLLRENLMKFLYDLFPLLLFFAAYSLFDIFVATAVAMVASCVQVAHYWYKHRRFQTMHLVTLVIILVFGGLTLVLHDNTFIKWKPSLVYWTLALLIVGSCFTEKTALQRMLGAEISLPPKIWLRLNLVWMAFFTVLGLLNLYVAFYFAPDLAPDVREKMWVYFKFPGTVILTLLFVVAQAPYMARHMPKSSGEQTP